jgi:hypothetical protein
MGVHGQLREVEHELTKDLQETTTSIMKLAEKYGVSKQAISGFCIRRGIQRHKEEHVRRCPVCQGLIKISKRPHSDFLTSKTIRSELGVGRHKFLYHVRILREKGQVSKRFGKLQSVKAERAYRIYFRKRLPVNEIGRRVGLKNFHSLIRRHRDLGWDVPPPLYIYDNIERSKIKLRLARKKRAAKA